MFSLIRIRAIRQGVILPLLLGCPLIAAASFEHCLDNFPNRTPPVVPSGPLQRDICFDSFAVLHSGVSKTPIFSVEKLNRKRLQSAKEDVKNDRFYPEARIPLRERSFPRDYKGSGYDQGHMAPAEDMPNSAALEQSFSLVNAVPQAPKNNRGLWDVFVEKPTRQYAMGAEGDVFVFTGPVFDHPPVKTIGTGRVWVPTYLYKLVYDPHKKTAWAYWVENKDDARIEKPISYQELVHRVGIEFLPGIELLKVDVK